MDSASNQVFPPFDALPAAVREEIFLHVNYADLNECQTVSSVWRDFVANNIKTNKSYVRFIISEYGMEATRRRVFGKVVKEGGEVVVETLHLLATCDEAEKTLYTLTRPDKGNDWPLKQYSCVDGLRETNSVTLVTSRFVNNMQVVAGHLVLFKQRKIYDDNNSNMPSVFNVASIPWGGRLPIESGLHIPGNAFHFSKLLLGKDCLYLVSKNAHVTWEPVAKEGSFRETKHKTFEESWNRPVVVHKLTKKTNTWKEVARLLPEHEFRVMEKFYNIPNREPNPKFKDQTCLLYLSNNIIHERYILVSCPLHGSYEMFDFTSNISMWQLNMLRLPFDHIRSIIKNAQSFSSKVLAAVRRDYVLIYAEPGVATLVSVREGRTMFQVEGCQFALSNRYVLPVKLNMITGTMKVVDSVSGSVSRAFTLPRECLEMDTRGNRPWHHDDNAYAVFESIAARMLQANRGSPNWPRLQRWSDSYLYGGHAMLDSRTAVYWARCVDAVRYIIGMDKLQLDE